MTLLPFQTFHQRNFTNFKKRLAQAFASKLWAYRNTHISGLVPSIVPHVIHHGGEQVQAGRDVVRKQEDAEGLKNK